PFEWTVAVQDEDGRTIRASIPIRLRLLGSDGKVLEERFTAAGSQGAAGTLVAPLNESAGTQTLEATELFSGKRASLRLNATLPEQPVALSLPGARVPPAPGKLTTATVNVIGKGQEALADPAENAFGPHFRDLVVTGDGSLAVMNAMNWDHNMYALDTATGEVRWRQRVGHYFAFAPQALTRGVAV